MLAVLPKVEFHTPLVTVPVVTKLESPGYPVVLVKTPDAGVPNAGVTNVGLLDNTTLPVPVFDVTPVPPCATATVVPSQVPVAIVPNVVTFVVPTYDPVATSIEPLIPAAVKVLINEAFEPNEPLTPAAVNVLIN